MEGPGHAEPRTGLTAVESRYIDKSNSFSQLQVINIIKVSDDHEKVLMPKLHTLIRISVFR